MQITDTVLMVRPANFGYNPETAESNAFQINDQAYSSDQISELAKIEFDELVAKLRNVGVEVLVFEDSHLPLKTDAVFPNNWITTHENSSIVTYPMLSPNRRLERREDIIQALRLKFQYENRIALERFEAQGMYLEGTGSMILDRVNKIAYACLSDRTNEELLEQFCKQFGYQKMLFLAVDPQNHPIYHTNVLMAMGGSFVVICLEALAKDAEKNKLLDLFNQTQKKVIAITVDQMKAFAGNMLQVRSKTSGESYLVMSQQAFESLTKDQIDQIELETKILYSPLNIIETYGGGSARCMIAEVFYNSNLN